MFWVGMVLLPFSVLAAMVPDAVLITVIAVAGCSALVLWDALRVQGNLAVIHLELPDIMRLTKDRDGSIHLRLQNLGGKPTRVRLGLPFPKEINPAHPDVYVNLPGTEAPQSLAFTCRPLKQGRFSLDGCFLETLSPLGFWLLRAKKPVQSEIRVFPNLFREDRGMTGLLLKRGIGLHPQRQVGKGRDFEQLREYQPGDSFEDIHWKATAKRGEPVTKIYQIERTQEVYVAIDASRLSARGASTDGDGHLKAGVQTAVSMTTILERYATAALALGLAAERQGDLFGMAVFDNAMRGFVRAKNGKAHYSACRDALFNLAPRNVSPDFTEVFTTIATYLRRRALVIFLTSIDDPVQAENFCRHIDILGRRHLVLVTMIKPALADPLFSDSEVASVDDLYRKLGGHLLWRELATTEKKLKRHGIDFSMVRNEKLCTELISQYLSVKRRQRL